MSKLLYIHIYPKDRNIEKTWFIQYKLEGKPVQKKYGGLAKLLTVEERLKEAELMVSEIQLQYSDGTTKKDTGPLLQELQQALKNHAIYLRPKSKSTYESKI